MVQDSTSRHWKRQKTMTRPRPPSRVETVTFPVFGISWWASPEDGSSIVAYGGGGGGSATGVLNKIVVRDTGSGQKEISTGSAVCVAVQIYQNPVTKTKWLLGAVDKHVIRYSLPSCEPQGQVEVDGCNALSASIMADKLAVGCEDGSVSLFEMSDAGLGANLWTVKTHVKAVCSISFAVRGGSLVSSAKDGTAKVWSIADGTELATLKCNVQDPKEPPPKRAPQILVRGCAFGDLEGKVIYTVASTRRGKSYLACWVNQGQGGYECRRRENCSPCPISAMSLSVDGGLMAMGGVDGTITLMDMEQWKVLKKFPEVHELPVTCIAARPFALPLSGEEDGVMIHAICASADSQMPFLTLQRRAPKSKSEAAGGWLWTLLWAVFIFWSLYRVGLETKEQCAVEIDRMELNSLRECFLHTVLVAPASRPGILVPPH